MSPTLPVDAFVQLTRWMELNRLYQHALTTVKEAEAERDRRYQALTAVEAALRDHLAPKADVYVQITRGVLLRVHRGDYDRVYITRIELAQITDLPMCTEDSQP